MDELISRQAAISLPVKPREDRYFQTQSLDDAYDYGWRSLQRCIEKLPSAQPERKKGKWIDHTDEGYIECPFCGSATNCDGDISELHYCFSCGADMREEEQDATD